MWFSGRLDFYFFQNCDTLLQLLASYISFENFNLYSFIYLLTYLLRFTNVPTGIFAHSNFHYNLLAKNGKNFTFIRRRLLLGIREVNGVFILRLFDLHKVTDKWLFQRNDSIVDKHTGCSVLIASPSYYKYSNTNWTHVAAVACPKH